MKQITFLSTYLSGFGQLEFGDTTPDSIKKKMTYKILQTTILTVLLLVMQNCLIAQTSPNFTFKDINGNSHNLYEDYLNKGIPVLVDVMTTWCGPCWESHESGLFDEIYHDFGVIEGTGEVQILMIEGGAGNDLADLNGNGSNTEGNWVEGTPYPIIDGIDAETNQSIIDFKEFFNAYSYPTMILICPDKSFDSNIYLGTEWTFQDFTKKIFQCTPPSDINDIRLLAIDGGQSNCENVDLKAIVHNNSPSTKNDITFTFEYDGQVIKEINWQGQLASNDVQLLNLGLLDHFVGSNNIMQVSIGDDDNPDNNTIQTQGYDQLIEGTKNITVSIESVSFYEDYQIVSSAGDTIFDSGPLNYNEYYTKNHQLPNNDCYEVLHTIPFDNGSSFDILDEYGTILLSVYEYSDISNPEPTFHHHLKLTKEITAVVDKESNDVFKIFPTVSDDIFNLEYTSTSNEITFIKVFNINGQLVLNTPIVEQQIGKNNVSISLNNHPQGIYYVCIGNNTFRSTQKIVKQ